MTQSDKETIQLVDVHKTSNPFYVVLWNHHTLKSIPLKGWLSRCYCLTVRVVANAAWAMTSASLSFSPSSTAAHQLRADRCQDHCGSAVLLTFFFLPVYQFSVILETCCHIWAFQGERDMKGVIIWDKDGWKDHQGAQIGTLTPPLSCTHTHVMCHRPKHQCERREDDAPSGWQRDKTGVLYCSTSAAWCALLTAPLPRLFRSFPLSLTSSLIAPRTPLC